MDELHLIHRSPPLVRHANAYRSRRTSIDIFNHCTEELLNFVAQLAAHGPDALDLLTPEELNRLVSEARFAFQRIHQRMRARRFPANLRELWPYLGLPIGHVAVDLNVSLSVLRSRVRELDMEWPGPSTPQNLLLAVQFLNPNEVFHNQVFRRDFVRVPRHMVFAAVHQAIRQEFQVAMMHGQQALTSIHVEIRGRRYGPVQTNLQWQEIVNHGHNVHRISVLLVLA